MVGSDGVLLGQHPHPRGFGCYPRLLARYVREKKRLRWEEAIHKMTSSPAARLNLQDRGLLRVGAAADLVVLDPERVADGATFAAGRRPPTGIEWVLVNGQVVVQRGEYLEGGTGRVLRPLPLGAYEG
jgi:N-acyl-D-amino-acid deacylase